MSSLQMRILLAGCLPVCKEDLGKQHKQNHRGLSSRPPDKQEQEQHRGKRGHGACGPARLAALCAKFREEFCLKSKMAREQPRKLSDPVLPLPFTWMCTGKHAYTWTGVGVGWGWGGEERPCAKGLC